MLNASFSFLKVKSARANFVYQHDYLVLIATEFQINYLDLGVAATALDARPTFEGYIYKENVFCADKTYDNATTLQEAVLKCNNDPQCASIEDRWGSGTPPIGLCKWYNGKRAGAGTYLLLRGN